MGRQGSVECVWEERLVGHREGEKDRITETLRGAARAVTLSAGQIPHCQSSLQVVPICPCQLTPLLIQTLWPGPLEMFCLFS